MVKSRCAIVAVLILVCFSLGAQERQNPKPSPDSLLSFSLMPGFTVPLGGDSAVYTIGGGALFSGEYRLPAFPLVYLGGSIGYQYAPIKAVTSLSLIQAAFDAGLRYELLPTLSVRAQGSGGYAYGMLNNAEASAGTPVFGFGLGLDWEFVPSLCLGLSGSYASYADLYNGFAVTLGMSYQVPRYPPQSDRPVNELRQPLQKPSLFEGSSEAEAAVEVKDLALGSVFPILHAYYDTSPLGRIVLVNKDEAAVTQVTVSLLVRQYMDAPKRSAVVAELKPHEERSINLYALFKNSLFEVKQSTKVPAEITVSYLSKGTQQSITRVETIRILDRNAMSWDDTCKAAAFVMPKEPAVLALSNQINSFVSPVMNAAIDKNLQTAMAFHDALRLFGISYVSPPLTSYADRSRNTSAIDSVKFPLETIEYRSGDCSDLAVLYSSLLESVQIETAFVTVPGHIFMAFALSGSDAEIRTGFTGTQELIFHSGKAWVPIEVTERGGSFLEAWRIGAREWRENLARDQAGFFPIREAWNKFEPVNFPGIGSQPPLPDQARVVKDFKDDVGAFVTWQVADREQKLTAAVKRSGGSAASLNALGVLYARYGMTDKAQVQFEAAVKAEEYLPALVNLGNVKFLAKDMEGALELYERAAKRNPHSPAVLLGLSRTNHELQNFGTARKAYDELNTLDPTLGERFSYLRLQGDQDTRAADAALRGEIVVWEESR